MCSSGDAIKCFVNGNIYVLHAFFYEHPNSIRLHFTWIKLKFDSSWINEGKHKVLAIYYIIGT